METSLTLSGVIKDKESKSSFFLVFLLFGSFKLLRIHLPIHSFYNQLYFYYKTKKNYRGEKK